MPTLKLRFAWRRLFAWIAIVLLLCLAVALLIRFIYPMHPEMDHHVHAVGLQAEPLTTVSREGLVDKAFPETATATAIFLVEIETGSGLL